MEIIISLLLLSIGFYNYLLILTETKIIEILPLFLLVFLKYGYDYIL